jgi:acetoacetyl-CoA synthetase
MVMELGLMEGICSRPRIQVRVVTPNDFDALCEFLQSGFRASRIPASAWRPLFEYSWRPRDSNLGFVMTADGEIVGFLGAIFARRDVADKSGIVCNCTSWYVLPEYRGASFALHKAAHRDRTLCYTNFTPNETTTRMLARMGFSPLTTRILILPALLNLETLLASRPLIIFDRETVYSLLDGQQRRIFDEHSAYDCLQGVVVDGKSYAYLVVKRRVWRPRILRRHVPRSVGIPISMILHCCAPEIIARHLERLKLALFIRQRTIALLAYGQLFCSPPRAFSRRNFTWYRSDVFEPRDLDGLYSELVLLPI